MPLPFILAGLAVAAVGTGAKKAYDGYQDSSRADDIIDRAKRKQRNAKDAFDSSQNDFSRIVETLGDLRMEVAKDIDKFQKIIEKLQKKKLSINLNINIPETTITQINSFTATAWAVSTGAFGGAATGAAAGYAIYGGVMALGAASTGTAIGTLSGVAATNAALAAIGGGSLAAGGLGIAGGTAILGGVVAAPVLALAAWSYASKAEEKLDKAREFRDKIDDEIVPKLEKGKSRFDSLWYSIKSLVDETRNFRDWFNVNYYIKLLKMGLK